MRDKPRSVLVVVGPTASGKSAAALAIAQEFDGEVINADSMQVYQDLRIITARPSIEDEAAAPHRLYGVIDGAQACSAALWRDLARDAITAAHEKGRLPILCGGTGLYLKALMQGLSPIPDIPEDIRGEVRRLSDAIGPEALHAELAKSDPETAATLNPTDPQRIARALEVWRATGKGMMQWRRIEEAQRSATGGPDNQASDPQITPQITPKITRVATKTGPVEFAFTTILLSPPREGLYAGIDQRFRDMIELGAMEEVEQLAKRNLDPSLPVMKALGVPELMAVLRGEMDQERAIEQAATKSRRYAKRQVTWFSRQIISQFLINEKYSKSLSQTIFSFIRENQLTG